MKQFNCFLFLLQGSHSQNSLRLKSDWTKQPKYWTSLAVLKSVGRQEGYKKDYHLFQSGFILLGWLCCTHQLHNSTIQLPCFYKKITEVWVYPLPPLMEHSKSPLRAQEQVYTNITGIYKYTKLLLHSCIGGKISVKRWEKLEELPSTYPQMSSREGWKKLLLVYQAHLCWISLS